VEVGALQSLVDLGELVDLDGNSDSAQARTHRESSAAIGGPSDRNGRYARAGDVRFTVRAGGVANPVSPGGR